MVNRGNHNMKKIVEKISKLLALSESTNEHEAKLSLMKAQEIMAKYNIEMKDVKIQREEIIENKVDDISIGLQWKSYLAQIIGENFRCEVLFACRGNSKKAIFIGYAYDTEIAISIFRYAYKVINRNANRLYYQYKKKGLKTKNLKRIYSMSFIKGLNDGYKRQVNAHQEYALVVVPSREVKKYANNISTGSINFKKTKKENIKTIEMRNIIGIGYKDGSDFVKPKKYIEQVV